MGPLAQRNSARRQPHGDDANGSAGIALCQRLKVGCHCWLVQQCASYRQVLPSKFGFDRAPKAQLHMVGALHFHQAERCGLWQQQRASLAIRRNVSVSDPALRSGTVTILLVPGFSSDYGRDPS